MLPALSHWPGGIVGPNGEEEYRSNGNDGFVQLPYCSGTTVAYQAYAFGMFYEENQPNEPNNLAYSNMLAGARIVENQIKAGISTWKNCSP